MAWCGAKGVWLRQNEKITFGDASNAVLKWDGTDLLLTTTGALKFDNCAGMTYAFKFDSVAGPVISGAVSGSQTHKIAILVNATPYYIALNTA
jgi:hypothetical protein